MLSLPSRTRSAPWIAPALLLALGIVAIPDSNATLRASRAVAQDASDIAQLEFTPGTPKAVTIYAGGSSGITPSGDLEPGRLYWYLPYTLENKGKKAGSFFVTVRAYSDKDRSYSDLALRFVEERVEKLEQRELFSKADLLEGGEGIGAYVQFAPGDKRECVAIFNPIDPEADKIRIEIHGLVDDIEIEKLPNGGYKVTERVLVLRYERPGDEFYTSLDSFEYKGREWKKSTIETKPESAGQ